MDIKNILENVNFLGVKNFNQFDVENLTCNSHDDNENGIYFCLKGTKVDGHDYIEEAKVNGAKCLVVERYLDSDLMQILVKDSRASMTEISSVYYEIPTSKMKFVGITGTNGKTTTSFLVKAYLSKLGKKVGLIGTQGVYFNKIMLPGKLTTPDPIELHRIIHEMEQNGIEYVVMEASAHAIALKKIDGLKFDTIALTNITQDHLDFFKTMDNYSRAKAELFSLKHSKNAIINIDDDYCYSIANQTDCNVKTVSIYDDADYSVQDCDFSVKETKAKVRVGVEDIDLKTNLIGRYNLSNTLTALAIVESLGFSLEEVKDAVNSTKIVVPGRFNILKTPTNYSVVVDFAHTPDGMEKILKTCKELTNNRIICVFGCGGDRDSSKRHIMGEIASRYADYSIVTSDNPRSEIPALIIKDITQNMHKNFETEVDRVQAIIKALQMAKENDIILILGKGAENYQEINGTKYPYSDYDVVDNYFKEETIKVE